MGKRGPELEGPTAGLAMVNDLVLVTANVKDYKASRGLTGEDWRA